MLTLLPRRHARLTTLVVTAAVLAVGCVVPPSPPPAPLLPAGLGVSWARDAGGTLSPDDSGPGFVYTPAFEFFETIDGVTSASAGTGFSSPTFAELSPLGFVVVPNGTARFPWNGFAGEGITYSPTLPSHSIGFPGGSCQLPDLPMGTRLRGLVPSPDGAKVAMVTRLNDSNVRFGSVSLHALEDGVTCPTITGVDVQTTDPNVEMTENGAVVWSPSSDAILFTRSVGAALSRRIVRLDAVAGSTPSTVLEPSAGCWLPLGWSVEDRVLLTCVDIQPGTPETIVTQLQTMPVTGGDRWTIDTATTTALTTTSSQASAFFAHVWHYGYYVPGTATIVYNDGSTAVPVPGGTVPHYRIRLRDDHPGGGEGPLRDADAPLELHPEPLASDPTTTIEVPNLEFVTGFVS